MPKVVQRKLSQGELSELERVQTWAANRKQLTNQKPNKNTMAFKPPSFGTGSGWSPENT